MGRKSRQESETGFYHVITRGNNKTQLFHTKNDFEYFLKLLKDHLIKHPIRIHHYCLMNNHIHILMWGDNKP